MLCVFCDRGFFKKTLKTMRVKAFLRILWGGARVHSPVHHEPCTVQALAVVTSYSALFGHSALVGVIQRYSALFGAIRRYSALFGSIRRYLGLFGAIWRYLGLFGAIWVYSELHGAIWAYLALFGFIRRYV